MGVDNTGILGHAGCPEDMLRHFPPMGHRWEGGGGIARVVRASAALTGGRAMAYALHDALPPMAAVRVTSNGGTAPTLREVPLAVEGHTPTLAAVQYLAHCLWRNLAATHATMGFGPLVEGPNFCIPTLGDALDAPAKESGEPVGRWLDSGDVALRAPTPAAMARIAKKRPVTEYAVFVACDLATPMWATLIWVGGADWNGHTCGMAGVRLVEAPRPIARAYSALAAANAASCSEAMRPDTVFATADSATLAQHFATGGTVRLLGYNGEPAVATAEAARARHGMAVDWFLCDKHGVALWARPDLVPSALEKVALATRAVERLASREGGVAHLPTLIASLNRLRALDFTRKA